jgi:thiamine pyrophosphate-dependent acetolactate synthase large subunit-like protein
MCKKGNTMRGDEYIAKILKEEGVEWLPCFPSNPLIESCAKEGIRPVAFRHERGAIMAADGYAKRVLKIPPVGLPRPMRTMCRF